MDLFSAQVTRLPEWVSCQVVSPTEPRTKLKPVGPMACYGSGMIWQDALAIPGVGMLCMHLSHHRMVYPVSMRSKSRLRLRNEEPILGGRPLIAGKAPAECCKLAR